MNAGTNANAPSVHKIFLSLMMMMSTILLLAVSFKRLPKAISETGQFLENTASNFMT